MNKKLLFLLLILLISLLSHPQVGINTENPQGLFHIDGLSNNPLTGTPSSTLQADDMVITANGNIGIGTTQPAASAALDVRTPNKAIRIPNVALVNPTDISTVPTPQAGMIVYNSTNNVFSYHDGTQWVQPLTTVTPVVAPKLMALAQSNNTNSTYAGGAIWYDQKIYDPENSFVLGTSTGSPASYTVKKAGLHQVFLNFTNLSIPSGNAWYLRIFKNSTVIAAVDATSAGGAGSACVFAISNCAVNDVIKVDKGGGGTGWASGETSKITIFRFE